MIRKNDEQKKISFDEIGKGLNQGLEHADPLRLEGLETLQRVRAVKDTSLAREQERLTKKYGARHPRVQAIAVKREANRELQQDVAVAVQRAQTPTVTPEPKAWTLHGYVRDAAFNGIQNLKVALYDENKRWVEEFGHACTDANGYFRLTPSTGAAQAEEAPANEDVQEKLSRAAAGKPARRFYIHVTNADDVTLHIDDDPVTPALGEVAYREIILGGDAAGCPPPGGGKPTKPTRGGGGKDTGKGAGKDTAPAKEGRYVGNRRKKELHDFSNVKPACQVDEIAAAQREYFSNQKQAVAAGYDLCAYCFGKPQSKR